MAKTTSWNVRVRDSKTKKSTVVSVTLRGNALVSGVRRKAVGCAVSRREILAFAREVAKSRWKTGRNPRRKSGPFRKGFTIETFEGALVLASTRGDDVTYFIQRGLDKDGPYVMSRDQWLNVAEHADHPREGRRFLNPPPRGSAGSAGLNLADIDVLMGRALTALGYERVIEEARRMIASSPEFAQRFLNRLTDPRLRSAIRREDLLNLGVLAESTLAASPGAERIRESCETLIPGMKRTAPYRQEYRGKFRNPDGVRVGQYAAFRGAAVGPYADDEDQAIALFRRKHRTHPTSVLRISRITKTGPEWEPVWESDEE